jgi:hypothetical protein
MIQSASQGFGAGGQRMASGVRGTFERVDPVLSASGGLIGMASWWVVKCHKITWM